MLPDTPPPAWYPDPANPDQLRWWDGNAWGPTADGAPIAPKVRPPSYLVWAIVLLVLNTCNPLCIAAVIYGFRVGKLSDAGDAAGALRASRVARTLNIINTCLILALAALAFYAEFLNPNRRY